MSLSQPSPAARFNKTRKQFAHKHLRKMFLETLEDRRVFATDTLPLTEWAATPFTQDRLIVEFVAGTTPEQRQAVYDQTGTTPTDYWPEINMAVVDLPGDGADVLGMAQTIHDLEIVDSVSPSFKVETARTPNDPLYRLQWAHDNTGQVGFSNKNLILPGAGTVGADANSSVAWDLATGSSEVVIAIIDSGIDLFHPDLRDKIWHNPGEIPGDGLDNDQNGYVDDAYGYDFIDRDAVPQDDDGHGTHVAGIAAAQGNNGIGVAGVNWNAKIMPLRAIGGADLNSAIGAIRYTGLMKSRGVNIVVSNNSYGLPSYSKTFSQPLYDAIKYATEAGVMFVAASGNDTLNLDGYFGTPDGYNLPGLTSVASTDRNDELSYFSNYGPGTVDIAAPGSDILSTWPTYLTRSAFSPGIGYDYLDGTSMASPYVAGAASLLRTLDPTLTPEETKQLLMSSSKKLPNLRGQIVSEGRIDLAQAIADLPHVTISGAVFNDLNRDGLQGAGESGVAGASVYLDKNNNGRRDTNEALATTAGNGRYTINSYDGAGSYTVRMVAPAGWSPKNDSTVLTTASRGATFSDTNFGLQQDPGSIRGTKYLDVNGSGVYEAGIDRGLAGITIYVDKNSDGILNVGEQFTITDSAGNYLLSNLAAGTYIVREQALAGFAPAAPGSDFTTVVVKTGQTVTAAPLLNVRAYDHGDAPRPFATTRQQGGAFAGVLPGFSLGATVDYEGNGVRSALGNANYDDITGAVDDEDGVTIGALFGGDRSIVNVTATNTAGIKGYFDLWIDYNGNGKWEEGTEHVFDSVLLGSGRKAFGIVPPKNIAAGPIYARARYSDSTNVLPTGGQNAGEVEDYAITVLLAKPVAKKDGVYTVQQDSLFTENPLNVLKNDLRSKFGAPQLVGSSVVTGPTKGTLRINDNGTVGVLTDDFYEYQPKAGAFGDDSFTYRVFDGKSFSNTATVSIFIQPGPLTLVDDFRTVFADSTFAQNRLDVRLNDIGAAYTADFTSVAFVASPESTTQLGTLRINTFGTPDEADDVLEYQPNAGVTGIERYTYTLTDTLGRVTTATLTLQVNTKPVSNDPKDSTRPNALASIIAQPTDANGNPITSINAGQTFYLTVYTQDNRTPNGTFTNYGVKGATADLLFDSRYFDAQGVVMENFATPPVNLYNVQDAQQDPTLNMPLDTAGLVNEVGGTNNSNDVSRAFNSNGRIVLYRVLMQVKANVPSGTTTTTFYVDPTDFTDPAAPVDKQPHDALWFNDSVLSPTPERIGQNNVNYVQFSDFVINGPAPGPLPGASAARSAKVAGAPILAAVNSTPARDFFDLTGDKVVNRKDVQALASVIASQQAAGNPAGAKLVNKFDITKDGNVDSNDLVKLIEEIRRRASAGHASTFTSAVDSIFTDNGDDLFA